MASREQKPMFDELFIVSDIRINFLNRICALYPNSRAVFWDSFVPYLKSLKHSIELATNVVAEDEIVDHVSARYDVSVVKLSEYDLSLAKKVRSKIPQSKSNINGRALNNNELFEVDNGPVVFCPANDTHVKMFEPIAKLLSDAQLLLFDEWPEENTQAMAESLKLKYEVGGPERLRDIRPSVLVVGNDWARRVWPIFEKAYRIRIPTVCIQEGAVDFATKRAMQWCDYPFVQGPIVLEHLPQKVYFLTGNPRFDSLEPCECPRCPRVMVNCNFTYGMYESAREGWVHDVVKACRQLDLDFFISQHPRDGGEFPEYPVRKSHPGIVQSHIADCSILVTRASGLVYEAFLLGRRVIYYNPHGEERRLFDEDATGALSKSADYATLVSSLSEAAKSFSPEHYNSRQEFLILHCGENDGLAAHRCASALAHISNMGYPRTGRNKLDWYNYWKARNIKNAQVKLKKYKAAIKRRLSAIRSILL